MVCQAIEPWLRPLATAYESLEALLSDSDAESLELDVMKMGRRPGLGVRTLKCQSHFPLRLDVLLCVHRVPYKVQYFKGGHPTRTGR